MESPLHPAVVHFPIVLTFILPFLILIFAFMMKIDKMSPQGWLVIIGLQMVVTSMGYLSLETGETEEHNVQKVVSEKLIHEHEEAAEIFVGSTVLALALGIAVFFLKREFQFSIQIVIVLITIVSAYLAYRTGYLGGELAYRHGGASIYREMSQEGILPTPGKNTSESPFPEQED